MIVYRVMLDNSTRAPEFLGTKAEAHAAAKLCVPRSDVFIDEVSMPTDKENLLLLLNQQPHESGVIQSWRLSPRGGLVPYKD